MLRTVPRTKQSRLLLMVDSVKGIVENAKDAAEDGAAGSFYDKMRSIGSKGTRPDNMERELVSYARSIIGTKFETYGVETMVLDSKHVTK